MEASRERIGGADILESFKKKSWPEADINCNTLKDIQNLIDMKTSNDSLIVLNYFQTTLLVS